MTPYADTEFGDDYFENILNTAAWDSETDDDIKTKALKEATIWIDGLNFKGQKADATQENQFPRGTDTEVPAAIKEACCDMALALLDGMDVELEVNDRRLVSTGYSAVRGTYNTGIVNEHVAAGIPSYRAWRKLLPYLRTATAIRISRV